MGAALYERHLYKDSDLPFLFHKETMHAENRFADRLHWHENLEFARSISGEGLVRCSANTLTLCPEEIVSINSDELHSFNHPFGVSTEYYCLIVDAQFCRENGIPIDTVGFKFHIKDKKATALFDVAYSACNAEGKFKNLSARTAVLKFLLYLCQNHLSAEGTHSAANYAEPIKKAIKYIKSNFMNPISLDEISAISGFSVYYFTREFKKFTGTTFVSFLNNVRCEKAAAMISGGASVGEACMNCGFNDIGYFSRTFLKIMGVPPSHYKNKQKP